MNFWTLELGSFIISGVIFSDFFWLLKKWRNIRIFIDFYSFCCITDFRQFSPWKIRNFTLKTSIPATDSALAVQKIGQLPKWDISYISHNSLDCRTTTDRYHDAVKVPSFLLQIHFPWFSSLFNTFSFKNWKKLYLWQDNIHPAFPSSLTSSTCKKLCKKKALSFFFLFLFPPWLKMQGETPGIEKRRHSTRSRT